MQGGHGFAAPQPQQTHGASQSTMFSSQSSVGARREGGHLELQVNGATVRVPDFIQKMTLQMFQKEGIIQLFLQHTGPEVHNKFLLCSPEEQYVLVLSFFPSCRRLGRFLNSFLTAHGHLAGHLDGEPRVCCSWGSPEARNGVDRCARVCSRACRRPCLPSEQRRSSWQKRTQAQCIVSHRSIVCLCHHWAFALRRTL